MRERMIHLWDLPVRLFHWVLLVLVIGSVVSVKIGGSAMVWHGRFGHLILALLVFRIVWGVIGSTHARFHHFVRGPGAVLDYLRGHWRGVGHTPLGALSVVALLLLLAALAVTGLFANDAIAFRGPLYPLAGADLSDRLTTWHRRGEWVLYGLVTLHVLAILYYTLIRRDNLILPMITGRKRVSNPAARSLQGGGMLPFMIALAAAAAAFWIAGGGLLPPPPPPAPDLGW
jgi:cytochrome b